jgi:hypothetical protein
LQHIDLPSVANHQVHRAEKKTKSPEVAPDETAYTSQLQKYCEGEWYHFKAVDLIEKIFFGTVTKKVLSTRKPQFFSKDDRNSHKTDLPNLRKVSPIPLPVTSSYQA